MSNYTCQPTSSCPKPINAFTYLLRFASQPKFRLSSIFPSPLHLKNKMANRSEDVSFQAGEAKGQAKAKKDEMVDKAKDACQSAKESCQEAGGQIKAKAQGAVDAVKDATGINKQS